MWIVVKTMDCISEVTKEECIGGNSREPKTELWGIRGLRRKLEGYGENPPDGGLGNEVRVKF